MGYVNHCKSISYHNDQTDGIDKIPTASLLLTLRGKADAHFPEECPPNIQFEQRVIESDVNDAHNSFTGL